MPRGAGSAGERREKKKILADISFAQSRIT